MAEQETCRRCGATVGDAYLHDRWHGEITDALSALQRSLRDLETSTKRSLQQFEQALRRSAP
jgi:hypothetical protein